MRCGGMLWSVERERGQWEDSRECIVFYLRGVHDRVRRGAKRGTADHVAKIAAGGQAVTRVGERASDGCFITFYGVLD